MSEERRIRDDALEEAARFVEGVSLTDFRGVIAKRKRDREDANLRLEARAEVRAEIASHIRALKTMRGTDAVAVLRELADLNPEHRHDLHLRDAWPLAWKGWLRIIAVNCIGGPHADAGTSYRIEITEQGRRVLDDEIAAQSAAEP